MKFFQNEGKNTKATHQKYLVALICSFAILSLISLSVSLHALLSFAPDVAAGDAEKYLGVVKALSIITLVASAGCLVVLALYVANTRTKYARYQRMLDEQVMLASNLPCGVFSCEIDDHLTFASFSDKFQTIVGYTKEEIATKFDGCFEPLLEPDDFKYLMHTLLTDENEQFQCDLKLNAKDGKDVWVRLDGRIVTLNNDRKLFGFIIDISEKMMYLSRLNESDTNLKSLMQIIPSGIAYIKLDDVLGIQMANPAFYKLCNRTTSDIRMRFDGGLLAIIDPCDRDAFVAQLQRADYNTTFSAELRVTQPIGKSIWLSANITKSHDKSQDTDTALCAFTNIDSLKESYTQAKIDKEKIKMLASLSTDVMFEYNIGLDDLTLSGSKLLNLPSHFYNFRSHLGSTKYVVSETIEKLKHCIDLVLDEGKLENFPIKFVSSVNSEFAWYSLYAYFVENGSHPLIIGKFVDITLQQSQLESLKTATQLDSLTGILNTTTAKYRIKNYIKNEHNAKSSYYDAMFILDIDNFKAFNDSLGHATGDEVLQSLANVTKRLFREQDVVGRIGGDEFIVFAIGFPSIERVVQKADELCKELHRLSFTQKRTSIKLSVSIGIAILGAHGDTYDELFDHADLAMYSVKKANKNGCALYDSSKIN